MLPPELAELEASYQRIYDQHTQGILSYEDAIAALDTIVTVDGSGAVWKVNPEAEGFLRGLPGGMFEPAEPVHFIPLGRPADSGAGPFPGAVTAPFDAVPGAVPGPPQWPGGNLVNSNPVGGRAEVASAPGGWPESGAPDWGGIPPAPAGTTGSSEAKKRSASPSTSFGFLAGLTTRQKQLGVVVIVVAILAIFLFLRGSSDDTTAGPTPGDSVPSASPSTPESSTPPTPEPSDVVEPETPLPVTADITRIQSALVSGDRALIAAEVTDTGNAQQLLDVAVTFAGWEKVGVDIRPGDPAVGKRGIVQRWEIFDPETGTVVREFTVIWQQTDGVWRLSALPKLN